MLCRGGNGNGPAVVLMACDAPPLGEAVEGDAEALVANVQDIAELGTGERPLGESGEDVGLEIGGCVWGDGRVLDDFEVDLVCLVVGAESEGHGVRGFCGAVLGSEDDGVLEIGRAHV